jgi:hypothetical protein
MRLRPAKSVLVDKPSVFRPANFVAWELHPHFCLFDAGYEPDQSSEAGVVLKLALLHAGKWVEAMKSVSSRLSVAGSGVF